MAESHWCAECDVPFEGERCPSCGTEPLRFTSRNVGAVEAERDQLKKKGNTLLQAAQLLQENPENGVAQAALSEAIRGWVAAGQREER